MPIETFPSANMHIRCLIQPTFQTPVLAQLPKDLRVFLSSPIYWSFFPFLLLFLHTTPFSPLHSSSLLLLSIFFLSLSLSSPKVTDSISCLKYYYSPIDHQYKWRMEHFEFYNVSSKINAQESDIHAGHRDVYIFKSKFCSPTGAECAFSTAACQQVLSVWEV